MICVRCTDLRGPRASGQQVHKVRFVASTLLDAVRKAETAPASAARAHAYLCELLPSSVFLPPPPSSLSFAFVAAPSISAGTPPSFSFRHAFLPFVFVFPHSESRAGFRVLSTSSVRLG